MSISLDSDRSPLRSPDRSPERTSEKDVRFAVDLVDRPLDSEPRGAWPTGKVGSYASSTTTTGFTDGGIIAYCTSFTDLAYTLRCNSLKSKFLIL